MKLLLDENLSPRLVPLLAPTFPGSKHVENLGLRGAADAVIWQRTQDEFFVIVSKDDDFRQRSFLFGWPPKIVWLTVGNAGTAVIAELLTDARARIESFVGDPEDGLLILRL